MDLLLHVPELNVGRLERRASPWRENEQVLLQGKAGIVAMDAIASPQKPLSLILISVPKPKPTSKPLPRLNYLKTDFIWDDR